MGTLKVMVTPDKSSLVFSSEMFAPTHERMIRYEDIEGLGSSSIQENQRGHTLRATSKTDGVRMKVLVPILGSTKE